MTLIQWLLTESPSWPRRYLATARVRAGGLQSSMAYLSHLGDDTRHPSPWQSWSGLCTAWSAHTRLRSRGGRPRWVAWQTAGCWRSWDCGRWSAYTLSACESRSWRSRFLTEWRCSTRSSTRRTPRRRCSTGEHPCRCAGACFRWCCSGRRSTAARGRIGRPTCSGRWNHRRQWTAHDCDHGRRRRHDCSVHSRKSNTNCLGPGMGQQLRHLAEHTKTKTYRVFHELTRAVQWIRDNSCMNHEQLSDEEKKKKRQNWTSSDSAIPWSISRQKTRTHSKRQIYIMPRQFSMLSHGEMCCVIWWLAISSSFLLHRTHLFPTCHACNFELRRVTSGKSSSYSPTELNGGGDPAALAVCTHTKTHGKRCASMVSSTHKTIKTAKKRIQLVLHKAKTQISEEGDRYRK